MNLEGLRGALPSTGSVSSWSPGLNAAGSRPFKMFQHSLHATHRHSLWLWGVLTPADARGSAECGLDCRGCRPQQCGSDHQRQPSFHSGSLGSLRTMRDSQNSESLLKRCSSHLGRPPCLQVGSCQRTHSNMQGCDGSLILLEGYYAT